MVSIEEVVLRKEDLNAHGSSYCCIKTIVDHCRSTPRLKLCQPDPLAVPVNPGVSTRGSLYGVSTGSCTLSGVNVSGPDV
jgi:hypothetical protein